MRLILNFLFIIYSQRKPQGGKKGGKKESGASGSETGQTGSNDATAAAVAGLTVEDT